MGFQNIKNHQLKAIFPACEGKNINFHLQDTRGERSEWTRCKNLPLPHYFKILYFLKQVTTLSFWPILPMHKLQTLA